MLSEFGATSDRDLMNRSHLLSGQKELVPADSLQLSLDLRLILKEKKAVHTRDEGSRERIPEVAQDRRSNLHERVPRVGHEMCMHLYSQIVFHIFA